MSHHRRPLYLCECLKAKEVVAASQQPLHEETRTQYRYHLTRRTARKKERVDQTHVFLRASEAKEVHIHIGSSSAATITTASSGTTKVVVQESRFELELESSVKQESSEMKHSGHHHALSRYRLRENDEIVCKICELDLVGSAYGCEGCGFFLHRECFDVPQEIKHKFHNHSLTLLDHSPYNTGLFLCNACRDYGYGFHYHCSPCQCDLHVVCAGLPRAVYRRDFIKYPLNIWFSWPKKDDEGIARCEICQTIISKNGFVYYNEETDYITHLDCALGEECSKEELEDFVVAIKEQLQSLKVK
ncbi:hypothetical protein NMG60_11023307 [Bertholletia excelsa]